VPESPIEEGHANKKNVVSKRNNVPSDQRLTGSTGAPVAIEHSWAGSIKNVGGHETIIVKHAIPARNDAVVAITEFKIVGDRPNSTKSSAAAQRSRSPRHRRGGGMVQ
jgi:hypothetical protein